MQAAADSVAVLCDQKKYLQGTGFHFSQVSCISFVSQVNCISLVSLLWRRENSISLNIWYAPSPKRNACKEMELPLLSSQLYLS